MNGVSVPQFQLAYICDTNHPSHNTLFKLCREVRYVWWGYRELELKECKDYIKSNETRILDIIMLVTNNNPQGYKEHVISFIVFDFIEGVTIIDWLENMNLYVSYIKELYKETIIGNMGNSGTSDLLLHIVQCWRECVVNEKK